MEIHGGLLRWNRDVVLLSQDFLDVALKKVGVVAVLVDVVTVRRVKRDFGMLVKYVALIVLEVLFRELGRWVRLLTLFLVLAAGHHVDFLCSGGLVRVTARTNVRK
jgi:hypothetical protein